MELTKAKFKQTEIGLIPEDWKLVPFDTIFSFYSTSNYSKAQMSEDDEVGCIHYGLIHAIKNTKYDLKNGIKYYVTSEQAKCELVRDGDVIMVDASEDLEGINKSVEVFGVGNNKYISGLHTYLLRDKKSLLADNFRGIVLNSQSVKNQMLKLAVGMKVFGVSKTQLINIKIPLPPTLEEQKAIATALSDVDELISNLDQLITKKKAIKQGAMQQLLTPPHKGGKRLAGFTGEWVEKKLGECLKYEQPTKYIVENSDYEGQSQTPVLTAGKSFLLGYTDEEFGIFNHYPVIIFDDFTTSKQFVNFGFKVKSSAMKMLQPVSEEIDIKFMFSIMNQVRFFLGDDHKRRWIAEYSKIDVFIPAKEEQKAITQIISDMDTEIEQLETKKSKYQDIKQGMMQELLTGKTRLV